MYGGGLFNVTVIVVVSPRENIITTVYYIEIYTAVPLTIQLFYSIICDFKFNQGWWLFFQVKWAEQEDVKIRVKRDLIENKKSFMSFSSELERYLSRNNNDPGQFPTEDRLSNREWYLVNYLNLVF